MLLLFHLALEEAFNLLPLLLPFLAHHLHPSLILRAQLKDTVLKAVIS
jgi:hypothetical protein